MRPTIIIAAALLLTALPAGAADWTQDERGRTATLHARTAPFPHYTRPQYRDDRVLAFVPAGYVPGDAVDIIVHYHGHRAEAVSSATRRRFAEQLVASGKAAILLCPQGPLRASDSAGGKHEDTNGLARFLREMLDLLAADGIVPAGARPGRVVLSGHSGAYRVIGKALVRGGVDVSEVWLHDAVYGEIATFARWAANDASRRLVSTHTPAGGTRTNNGELRRQLRELHVPVVASFDDIAGCRAAVIAVPEGHDEATKRFEVMATTSNLDDIPRETEGLIDAFPGW
jgi:hypothetical protein